MLFPTCTITQKVKAEQENRMDEMWGDKKEVGRTVNINM
jgi:hypothetical protein